MIAPVVITHHGRDRLILSSIADYAESGRSSEDKDELTGEVVRLKLKLNTLLSNIHECFIAFDDKMRVTTSNNKAELYFGLSSDQMLGRDLRDIKALTSDSISWEYYVRILRLTHEPVQFFADSTLHRGSTLTMTAFPFDGDVGVLFSSTSPHEEAVQRLRRERALHAAVAADPMLSKVSLSLRGGITEADKGFARLTGFSEAQLTSMMLVELLHPHDRLTVTRALDGAIRDVSSATVEARLLARNGDMRKLRLNFSAVSGDVQSTSAVAIAVDLGPETE